MELAALDWAWPVYRDPGGFWAQWSGPKFGRRIWVSWNLAPFFPAAAVRWRWGAWRDDPGPTLLGKPRA